MKKVERNIILYLYISMLLIIGISIFFIVYSNIGFAIVFFFVAVSVNSWIYRFLYLKNNLGRVTSVQAEALDTFSAIMSERKR